MKTSIVKLFESIAITGLVLATGIVPLRGESAQAAAAFKENLDGAQGKVFRVDLNKKRFEFLRTLEYQFDKDVGGKPWHTVYWTDGTRINEVAGKPPRTLAPGDLAKGFWKGTIHGKEVDGKFIIDSMDVEAAADPCAGDDPKLPRVLIVGDSIAFMCFDAVKAALKGVANCHLIDDNCWSVYRGSTFADYWLGDYKQKGMQWDVIQFNSGLHDLKQSSPSVPYAVPLDKYKKYLEKEIQILQRSGAKLIWCTTTPVPNSTHGKYGRQKGASVEFNKAAMEVVKKYPDIQVNDLFKVVNDSPAFDKWRKGGNVHFSAAQQPILARAVADAVVAALKVRNEMK